MSKISWHCPFQAIRQFLAPSSLTYRGSSASFKEVFLVSHPTRYLVKYLKSVALKTLIFKDMQMSGLCLLFKLTLLSWTCKAFMIFFKQNRICFFQIVTAHAMLNTVWLTNQIFNMIWQNHVKLHWNDQLLTLLGYLGHLQQNWDISATIK